MIPEDIKNAINKGLRCPICKKGIIQCWRENINGFLPTTYLQCSMCYKRLVIRYREKPFKILYIVEQVKELQYG